MRVADNIGSRIATPGGLIVAKDSDWNALLESCDSRDFPAAERCVSRAAHSGTDRFSASYRQFINVAGHERVWDIAGVDALVGREVVVVGCNHSPIAWTVIGSTIVSFNVVEEL